MMTYNQALNYIHGIERFGSKLGLETITELLNRLGNPQNSLKVVHIAGTNGKGSVSNICANALTASGFQTGLFISPFVEDFRERIQVCGVHIGKSELAKLTVKVKKASLQMVKDGFRHPTEFEFITALALLHFQQKKCEYAVLEVGMGGRLDSTNIVPKPEVTIIMSISFDHCQYLGDTLDKIAYEKAGIIKSGVPCVVYPIQEKAVLDVIRKKAEEEGAPVIFPDTAKLTVKKTSVFGNEFAYDAFKSVTTKLGGKHQVYNAITAMEALRLLGIEPRAVLEGVQNTKFGSRLEVVSRHPAILIDGAHNVSGMQALCNAVSNEGKKAIFICAMLKDKEYDACMKLVSRCAKLLITARCDNIRALSGAELARTGKQYLHNVIACEHIEDAVDTALSYADEDDFIVICGSLYMTGEAKKIVVKKLKIDKKSQRK